MRLPLRLPRLLEPWEPLDGVDPGLLEDEAKREISAGHALFSVELRALCHRSDCDDVLFWTSAPHRPFAVVHLTWVPRERPPWPSSFFFHSLEHWVRECMKPDHDNWVA